MTTLALRPYQIACLDAIAAARDSGLTRLLVQAATGSGKTQVFATLPTRLASWLASFPENERKVLIIAHREELIDQAAARIHQLNPSLVVSVEQGDRHSSHFADVTVASIQTLTALKCRRLKRLLRSHTFRVVVYDECHHASSPTARTALVYLGFLPPADASDIESLDAPTYDDAALMGEALKTWDTDAPKDRLLVGFTATPNRSDGVGLGAVFQSIVFSYPIKRAIEDGWLVPIIPWVVETDTSLDDVRLNHGEFNQRELADAVNTAKRNQLAVAGWKAHADGLPTLAFTVDVAHAHALADAFTAAGVRARALSGETPKDDRREILRSFTEGRIDMITNCFDEETEILTHERGWVAGHEIADGDYVAAVSPQSGVLTWEQVRHVVRRERMIDERMVLIQNQTLNLRVTEGHRMLWRTRGAVEWKITEAQMLPVKAAPYEFRVAAHGTFYGVPLSDVDLEFLGLFATDGSLNVDRASVEIVQSALSPMCAEIERILTGCGFDWRVHAFQAETPAGEVKPYRRYRVPKGNCGGSLARIGWVRLKDWLDKSLSPMLSVCTAEQFAHLLHGIWIGDGDKAHMDRPNGATAFYNTDSVLVDRVQAWAVTRGMACSVSWHDNGPLATKQIADVRVRDRDTVCTNNASVPTSGGNPATFEVPSDRESVWCVTNDTGTVIVRRRGRAMVVGQCMVLTEGTDLPLTQCILHAKPTKSATLYEQMTGRGLRIFPGKASCIVLDLVDVARKHSLQQAPVLYGLPPGIKTAGDDLAKMEGDLEALKAQFPNVDFAAMLAGENFTLAQLQAKASTFDIWTVQDLGAFGAGRALNWIRTGDTYRLQYPWSDGTETLIVEKDLLGHWSLSCTLRPHAGGPVRQRTLGAEIPTAQDAAGLAEAYVLAERQSVTKLKDKDAPWRKRPASPKQLGLLSRWRIPHNGKTLTMGQASDLIDMAQARRSR